MTAALHGNLHDFGIGEVFQLIGQQRKTGVLDIEGAHDRIGVTFLEGKVVSAASVGPHEHAALGDMLVRTGLLTPDLLVEVERAASSSRSSFQQLLVQMADLSAADVEEIEALVTNEAIFALLRWSSGSFHFHPQTVQLSRDPSRLLPAEQILMDGLRMVDEWRALDPDATREDGIFQHCGSFETYLEWASGDSPDQLAEAEQIFLSIDGRTLTRRVIDLSRLGTFDGARVLSGLRRAGVIEPLAPSRLPRAHRRHAAERVVGRCFQMAGALLPFVLLAGLAWLAHRPAPPDPEEDFPIARRPAQAARAHQTTRRLRHLAEAYRFQTGAWPGGLEELADRGWVEAAALAPAQGGPYHYYDVRSGEGAIVLAPKR